MFLLAYRNLRTRLARTLLTAFAIALGVGMIFAMRLVGVAVKQTADEARTSRLAGADLEVTSANGVQLRAALAVELATRAEVEKTAPTYVQMEGELVSSGATNINDLTSLLTQFKGTGLRLLGVDPARTLTPYELIAGSFFTTPDAREVLLPTSWAAQNGVGIGSSVHFITGDQANDYTVVGLLKESSLPGGTLTAWLPLKAMQAAFDRPDAATSVLIRLKPNVSSNAVRDALQSELGAPYTVTSAQGGASNRPFFGTIMDFALPFAGVAILLSGAFLVYNAFAITLTERRREIGQLRTLGMTRGQVLTQTLAEALLIALFGSAVGLVLGVGLGRGMLLILAVVQGVKAANIPLPLDGALLSVGAGVVITLLVIFNLAREAGRVSPLVALRIDDVETRGATKSRPYWIGAIILFLVYLGLHIWADGYIRRSTNLSGAMGMSFLAPFLLAGVVLLILPLAVQGLVGWSGRLVPRGSVTARLAVSNLARGQSRATLTTATLAIGLMLVVALSGITLSLTSLFVDNAISILDHDFMLLRPFDSNNVSFEAMTNAPPQPPLSLELQAALDNLSHDANVYKFGQVMLPGYSMGPGSDYAYVADLRLYRDHRSYAPIEGSWAEADRYFAAGPAVILPELPARRHQLHPGDTIEVNTFKGRLALKVAMVGGFLPVLSPEVGEEYFHAYPWMVFVDAKPGIDKAALETQLKDIAREHALIFTAEPKKLGAGLFEGLFNVLLGMFAGLTSLSGIVAGLGLINTLVASVLERQRELGMLRALGLSRAQVRGMVVLEAGLLGLIGSLIGVLGGLAMSVGAGQLINAVGTAMFSIPVSGLRPLPWAVAGVALLAGPLISVLAALLPADRAANVNPTEAMRAEGSAGFLKPAAHLGPTGMRGFVARLPLAAKLSLTTGLIIVLTVLALVAVVVNTQRQLLEDNVQAIASRGTDAMTEILRGQIDSDVTELTPETVARLRQKAGAELTALQTQLMNSNSRYEFGMTYLFMTNAEHQVVFSSAPEYLNRTLTDTVTPIGSGSLVRITDWSGDRVFEATAPLENQAGQRIGLLVAGLSTGALDQVFRDTVWSALWISLAALTIAVLVTAWFTRRALAPVAHMAQASQAVARGDLSQRIPEVHWDEVGQLARAFNDMVKGLTERDRIRDLFGRYVSREVQEAVMAGRVTFKGERKTITALYCDMRGSTTFAEQHAPEEVMDALNQYFEVIILATEAYGGIVNRFVGDEAVCVFGAPTHLRDHADHALQAALAMRQGLAYVNQKRTALGLPTLKFGIGLNTGEVVAGATGTEERHEYTVIGDAMNLGARIQGLNKTFPEHDILLSEYTRAALGDQLRAYAFADLGEAELRGRSQLVRIYGLIGLGN